ncbi:hypothetical protein B5E58_12815 [Tyzzerella sp. An114]|uniref:Flp1 family type IVb pilin n=1 Tax=Tyzzerella sp. An114 TaxID=1965545 RepID=UPI000B452F5E|nr:Flp1 family type IVb pilin [Tyzzerella sp. An114]OUQ55116.1 hypothetical protein B5E58_12815 [Tyzzerella sp. An114]
MNFIKSFIMEEDGIATIEIAIILAIGIALAVVFKDKIEGLWDQISGTFDSDVTPDF